METYRQILVGALSAVRSALLFVDVEDFVYFGDGFGAWWRLGACKINNKAEDDRNVENRMHFCLLKGNAFALFKSGTTSEIK